MNLNTTGLPDALAEEAREAWQRILERADSPLGDELRLAFRDGPLAQQLPRVLACSPFVADLARRKPELLLELVRSGELQESLEEEAMLRSLRTRLAAQGVELGPELRRFRQWHMLRIVWRDFCRLADTRETILDTSLLAEACIAEGLAHCHAALATEPWTE